MATYRIIKEVTHPTNGAIVRALGEPIQGKTAAARATTVKGAVGIQKLVRGNWVNADSNGFLANCSRSKECKTQAKKAADWFPISNRGGIGERFETKEECQTYCDGISNKEVFWWAEEINAKDAEDSRAYFY